MNLIRISVDSYSGDAFFQTVLGKIKTKNIGITTEQLNRSIKFINTFMPKNIYQVIFLKEFKEQINKLITENIYSRTVNNVGPYIKDYFFELDAMGVEKYSNDYIVVISTCDSLDLVLNRLCGADMNKIRNIDNYQLLSRALITGDLNLLSNIELKSLLNIDENLDSFLISRYSASRDKFEFIRSLSVLIVNEAQYILDETMKKFRTFYEEDMGKKIVLRCMSCTRLVCGVNEPMDYEVTIGDNYYLKLKSHGKYEFINYVQDSFCTYERSND